MVMLLILKMKTQQLVILCLVLFSDAGFAARDSRRSRSSPRKQCRILDPPSINVTFNTHSQPETLQEILNNGIHQMQLKDHDKTAILVMGNTGSGKTTLTQILSGNLSQLHAVMTHTHKLVIIDENNRIGLPTTKSKTFVPEYVVNPENNISFYDCPGFDDNRGAEKDIAAMYFINSITQHINKVKFLFVVTQSSLIPGNDRLDFDLLVTHASRFLSNMSKFSKSIGLIVSKVNSFSEFGIRLDDDQILDGVVGFMRQYTVTLKEDLQHCRTDGPKREILLRKLQFVEALLDQADDNEDFPRIWFIRHVPECGPFSEIPYVAEVKSVITDLYMNKLNYSETNSSDFGFTLKDTTVIKIVDDYVPQIKAEIVERSTQAVNELLNNLQTHFETEISSKFGMREVLLKITTVYKNLNEFATAWRNQCHHNFSGGIEKLFDSLGYSLPEQFANEIRKSEDVLKFYEKVSSKMTTIVQPSLEPFISTFQNQIGNMRTTTSNYIRDRWTPDILERISELVTNLMCATEEVYLRDFYGDLNLTIMSEKYHGLKLHYENLLQLKGSWCQLSPKDCSNSSRNKTILTEIYKMYFILGYEIPKEQISALEKYEKLLDSFGNFVGLPIKRNLRNWLLAPTNFIEKLGDVHDCYDFFDTLSTSELARWTWNDVNCATPPPPRPTITKTTQVLPTTLRPTNPPIIDNCGPIGADRDACEANGCLFCCNTMTCERIVAKNNLTCSNEGCIGDCFRPDACSSGSNYCQYEEDSGRCIDCGNVKLQLAFVVDASSTGALNSFKQLANLTDSLKKIFQDPEFAVTSFADWDTGAWTAGGRGHNDLDGCYRLVQNFTTDESQIVSIASKMRHTESGNTENGDTALAWTSASKDLGWKREKIIGDGRQVIRLMILVENQFLNGEGELIRPGNRTVSKGDGTDTCRNNLPVTRKLMKDVLARDMMSVIGVFAVDEDRNVIAKWDELFSRIDVLYSSFDSKITNEDLLSYIQAFVTRQNINNMCATIESGD